MSVRSDSQFLQVFQMIAKEAQALEVVNRKKLIPARWGDTSLPCKSRSE